MKLIIKFITYECWITVDCRVCNLPIDFFQLPFSESFAVFICIYTDYSGYFCCLYMCIMPLFPLQMSFHTFDQNGKPLVLFFTVRSELSNFFPCIFHDPNSGLRFNCNEQLNVMAVVMACDSPRDQKEIGKRVVGFRQQKYIYSVPSSLRKIYRSDGTPSLET